MSLLMLISLVLALHICHAEDKVPTRDIVLQVSDSDAVFANRFERGTFNRQLINIGAWLRNHKYHEVDQRYSYRGKENMQPYFFKSFPKPPLNSIHSSLAKHCRESLVSCVKEIHQHINSVESPYIHIYPSSPYRLRRVKLPGLEYPWLRTDLETFKNRLELFEYRMAASYFMCFYTLQRLELLRKFHMECHETLVDWSDTGKLELLLSYDYRSYDTDFDCALLSFCPDVCCGRVSGESLRATVV